MTEIYSILTAVLVCSALFLAFAAIRAVREVTHLQESVNKKLVPYGYHWQLFTLTRLPDDQGEREQKLGKLAEARGQVRGMSMDGFTAIFIGLWFLARWSFYPATKKAALRELAGPQKIEPTELSALANQLR